MKTFKNLLLELNACEPAIDWAEDKTIEEVIDDCPRVTHWMPLPSSPINNK